MRPPGMPGWHPKGLWVAFVNTPAGAGGHPTVDIPELGARNVPTHGVLIDFDPATGAAGTGPHTHALTGPTFHAGDRVLVGFLAGNQDRPIVLGRFG